MITNKEVFENGELIDHNLCDWDPIEECCRSNGSAEATYEYKGSQYHLFLDVTHSFVYNPRKPAERVPVQEEEL